MSAKRFKIFVLIFFSSVLLTQGLGAASFYSSKGLGVFTEGIGAQGLALGGVGVALMEDRALSSMNPATFLPAGLTRISVHFLNQTIDQKNTAGTGLSRFTNSFGGQFLVPLGENFSIGVGMAPLFLADYAFESEQGTGESAYRNISSGKGSLNKFFLGFFSNIKNRFALGATWNYSFGKYDETWELNYYNENYDDTSDILQTKLKGFNFSTGAVFQALKNWNVGVVLSTALSLKTEHEMTHNYRIRISEFSTDRARTTLNDGNLKLPFCWGIGTSIKLFKRKLMLTSEYFNNPFSKIEAEVENMGQNYNDYHRISFGISYLPSTDPYAKYFKHIPLRAGFYFKQLQIKYANNNPVNEYAVTFGSGLPFFFTLGRLDLALAIGKRGNISENPVEENFIDLMVTVTAGEKWFIQGRNK